MSEERIAGRLSTEIPSFRCACGELLDAATSAPNVGTSRDARPDPGDLTVCFGCGRAYQFDAELRHVPLDVDALPEEDRANVRKIQASVVRFRGRRS